MTDRCTLVVPPGPAEDLPLALADLHRSIEPGAPVTVILASGRTRRDQIDDLFVGAGFAVDRTIDQGEHLEVRAMRLRTLADTVGPGMRLLVCGLNPSVYAADAGVGYARPGNRFWPAALAAGLVTVDRDARHALHHHGVGMTDLVKRATRAASELRPEEHILGLSRVARLCEWLRPSAVCVVGLAGWRAAVDRRAVVGSQPRPLGGSPVYVMPSTSGLNASTQHDGFVAHLRAALALAR